MRTLFIVRRMRGPAWDASTPMRSQPRWNEHAAFMDALAAGGFIVLGGPIGASDDLSDDVLLIVDAKSEEDVRATLSRDPWVPPGLLEIQEIRRWTVLLEAGRPG
jgi:uncharacterized protein YciI